ncbi:MAG: Tfp pilus assembly protein FimT/FimU [Phycisphaerales bacterium]
MTHHRARTTNSISTRAFSLVEIVIVLAIVSAFAAIAMPRYAAATARHRLSAATLRIQSDLAYAIGASRSLAQGRTIRFDAATDSYTITGLAGLDDPDSADYEVRLAHPPYHGDIRLVWFGDDNALAIDGFGVLDSDGAIVISVGGLYRNITVDAASGKTEARSLTRSEIDALPAQPTIDLLGIGESL